MQKDYIAVFYFQTNYVKFDIFRTLNNQQSVYFNRDTFHNFNV